MKAHDFMFAHKFASGLTDELVGEACDEVEARFAGVFTLWQVLPPHLRESKRRLCLNYLVAWQIMTNRPDLAPGLSGTGGMPLSHKMIGDIHLGYDMPLREGSLLKNLTTNTFGLQALEMIQTAPENYTWVT